MPGWIVLTSAISVVLITSLWPKNRMEIQALRLDLDLSRFCAAPGARLSHLPFESVPLPGSGLLANHERGAFPAQC